MPSPIDSGAVPLCVCMCGRRSPLLLRLVALRLVARNILPLSLPLLSPLSYSLFTHLGSDVDTTRNSRLSLARKVNLNRAKHKCQAPKHFDGSAFLETAQTKDSKDSAFPFTTILYSILCDITTTYCNYYRLTTQSDSTQSSPPSISLSTTFVPASTPSPNTPQPGSRHRQYSQFRRRQIQGRVRNLQ